MAADQTGSDGSDPSLHRTSEGGLSGSHGLFDALEAPVATATGSEKNKIVLPLRPVACWGMGDVRFAFDSSFPDPSAAEEFALLAAARESHVQNIGGRDVYPPITIFGHADPVGQDEYNKKLSGRRARAIYAALVRDTDAWEKLYQPHAGDEWGTRSIQTMLGELSYYDGDTTGTLDDDTRSAVRAFQEAEGLAVDAQPGPQTRAKLFERYMDRLCGTDLHLSKTDDFLARGNDAGGKGDYQGCGEFNPVLMFSAAEKDQLNQPEQIDERNAQNAPNRRVLALLFPPGEEVDPTKWPCPRASEGPAGCRKRFWSDADTRRSFQAQRRLYEVTRDTFACRFYDILNERSPCERALAVLRVRLHDSVGHKMPRAEYQLEYAGRTKSGRADREGFVSDTLDPAAETCTVRWGRADDSDSQSQGTPSDSGFLYEIAVFVPLLDSNSDDGLKRRLHNLGYPEDAVLEANLRAFQAHHELEISGQADDATKAKLKSIYGNALDEAAEADDATAANAPDSEQRT